MDQEKMAELLRVEQFAEIQDFCFEMQEDLAEILEMPVLDLLIEAAD